MWAGTAWTRRMNRWEIGIDLGCFTLGVFVWAFVRLFVVFVRTLVFEQGGGPKTWNPVALWSTGQIAVEASGLKG